MRRLTALIKKIAPFPENKQIEFFKIAKRLDLMPGECLPDNWPTGTLLFIEDGLLILTRYNYGVWKCVNFYCEGTMAGTFSGGAAEMEEDSYRVRAVEPTHIYYWTKEDNQRAEEIYPAFILARQVLRSRSFKKNQERTRLFRFDPSKRIKYVNIRLRYLLRAPFEDLCNFLHLETDRQKKALKSIQKTTPLSDKQLSKT